MLQYTKISQNPSFGSRGGCFWSESDIQILMWPWKWGQGHQNLTTSFPRPNNVSMPLWSNSAHWFRRKSADKELCRRRRDSTKSTMSPLPFVFFCFFFFLWGRGHNLALIYLVVSEVFEECGRRHRQACLYDKLTNQYIKRSAHIIMSKISRIKMTYTFEDAVKENQIERNFTGLFLCSRPVTQKDFKMRFCSETFLRQLTGHTFILIDSTFEMLYFIGRGFAEVQILKK